VVGGLGIFGVGDAGRGGEWEEWQEVLSDRGSGAASSKVSDEPTHCLSLKSSRSGVNGGVIAKVVGGNLGSSLPGRSLGPCRDNSWLFLLLLVDGGGVQGVWDSGELFCYLFISVLLAVG